MTLKLRPDIDSTIIMYHRSIFSFLMCFFLIKWYKLEVYPREKSTQNLLIMRCIFGGVGHFSYFLAYKYLSVSEAIPILLTAPVWTAILAYFILKEKLNWQIMGAILFSFSGIILIAKPSFVFNSSTDSVDPFGVLMAINFSLSNSVALILLRVVSKTKVSNIVFLHYVFVPGAIFGTIGILYTQNTIQYDFNNLFYLFSIAF
jgi:drug/metabolite transporter (DMT)-like permease